MTDRFIYTRGTLGRGVLIDASGRLLANQDSGQTPFVFSLGETGRALTVDASGRLLINLAGLFQKGGTFINPSLPLDVAVWRANKAATVSNVYALRQGASGDSTSWNVRINQNSILTASGNTFIENQWSTGSLATPASGLSIGDTLNVEVGLPSGAYPSEFSVVVDMEPE